MSCLIIIFLLKEHSFTYPQELPKALLFEKGLFIVSFCFICIQMNFEIYLYSNSRISLLN